MNLSNEQWLEMRRMAPKLPPMVAIREQKPVDSRAIFAGILWVLRSGQAWKALPESYPPYELCRRCYSRWARSGVFDDMLRAWVQTLN